MFLYRDPIRDVILGCLLYRCKYLRIYIFRVGFFPIMSSLCYSLPSSVSNRRLCQGFQTTARGSNATDEAILSETGRHFPNNDNNEKCNYEKFVAMVECNISLNYHII